MKITRTILRTAVLGGITLGAAALFFPHHTRAGLQQLRTTVQNVVDDVIDDPIIMRERLQTLADRLPDQIAELRSELGEVELQIAQLTRDSDVSQGVVAMTSRDLSALQNVIGRADAARAGGEVVRVRFDARNMSVDNAKQEFKRINQIRTAYEDRLAANERDVKYLEQQRTRLSGLLAELENEFTTIQSQMWQIDRKIDAIARNEKLVKDLETRERSFSEYASSFDVDSLNDLQSRLRQWEIEIDARFERLDRQTSHRDYEDAVRWQMEQGGVETLHETEGASYDVIEPNVIEESTSAGDSIALAPRIIE
ncbi:MAG: hypothetical protein ACR2GY_07095 [Phycisphaerales bacterium]